MTKFYNNPGTSPVSVAARWSDRQLRLRLGIRTHPLPVCDVCVHFQSQQPDLCSDHRLRRGGRGLRIISVGFLWGVWMCSPPTLTLGGNYLVIWAPAACLLLVAPSGPLSPIWWLCRGGHHTCTPAQIKSQRSNFKSVSGGLFFRENKTNLFP